MKRYLYFSLMPESLIASMLPPEDFGKYMAVGSKKRTRGQAIFFEVDIEQVTENFPLSLIDERCVPHPDGKPKCSVYLSIYQVLEKLPIKSLKSLYLVTDDGKVLQLEKAEYKSVNESKLHLYQELCPVTPRIASSLSPVDFLNFVTDRSQPVSVPKLVFVELILNGLGDYPLDAPADNIPYPNLEHLRDCLIGLIEKEDKPTKTVIRYFEGDLLYRTCKNGFFVGNKESYLYYPFPDEQTLEDKYHDWWRSALVVGFK